MSHNGELRRLRHNSGRFYCVRETLMCNKVMVLQLGDGFHCDCTKYFVRVRWNPPVSANLGPVRPTAGHAAERRATACMLIRR